MQDEKVSVFVSVIRWLESEGIHASYGGHNVAYLYEDKSYSLSFDEETCVLKFRSIAINSRIPSHWEFNINDGKKFEQLMDFLLEINLLHKKTRT